MRIIKKGGKAYIELPEEFSLFENAEVFKLRDGYYLLSIPLGNTAENLREEKAEKGFHVPNEAEKRVLKRLLSIRFQNRTPAYVERVLSQEEKETLKELEKKAFINLFKSKKYPNGVYNINDKIYGLLYGKEVLKKETAGAKHDVQNRIEAAATSNTGKKEIKKEMVDPLEQHGYVIGTSKDLQEIINRHKNEIKAGQIKGLKGFDGKFYIAKTDYFEMMSPLILKQLDKERNIEEIAANLRVEPDAVRTVLHILAEAGDVIEKRKGVYAAI
ncbi:MAG: hypothetical protein QXT45_03195 [Candidatus Bilamarchaeaceae archaeon]